MKPAEMTSADIRAELRYTERNLEAALVAFGEPQAGDTTGTVSRLRERLELYRAELRRRERYTAR